MGTAGVAINRSYAVNAIVEAARRRYCPNQAECVGQQLEHPPLSL